MEHHFAAHVLLHKMPICCLNQVCALPNKPNFLCVFFFPQSGINNVLDARSIGMKIFEDYASSWHWILM